MDFMYITEKSTKNDGYILKPNFVVMDKSDLMIRGKSFYAVWDPDAGLWSLNEHRVAELIDRELDAKADELRSKTDQNVSPLYMRNFSTNSWKDWRAYLNNCPDVFHALDQEVKFSNDPISKEDYASFTLDYPLREGPIPNYESLMSILYDPEERQKLEWGIGAIISGDSKKIQKFFVLYGSAGSGKSTFLNILTMLFGSYTSKFEAKELGQANNQFAMESLRNNPLVAIQHDGDLSRIEDNTRLNSIVSHEEMIIKEKYKPGYPITMHSMLFMGTNKPVKITDAKSGIIRRLIDVSPSGRKLNVNVYNSCMSKIKFELGGIAWYCLKVYEELGPNYYDKYTPISMMYQTDPFFNFVEEQYYDFKNSEYITLNRAWDLYKKYCEDGLIPFKMSQYKLKEELKNYFTEFYETKRMEEGKQKRKVYIGFKDYLFDREEHEERDFFEEVKKENRAIYDKNTPVDLAEQEQTEMVSVEKLTLEEAESELDSVLGGCKAQYATSSEIPIDKWDNVTTTLKEVDTRRLHYVMPPENHIVVDFDLKDDQGNKSAELNLTAAANWPMTYAEFSKGGAGVHLHYIYDGDVSKLSALYAPGIEIKIFRGKSSLRRKLTYCNNLPVAHLSSGLPLKEEKKMVNFNRVMSEKGLRDLINRNLRKEIAPATKPSIDFIYNDLEAAYKSGLVYDVRDMRPKILAFANNSSHQRDYCVRLVSKMKFWSEPKEEDKLVEEGNLDDLVFYDVEVFPNLFVVCWKKRGKDNKVVSMVNPSSSQIEDILKLLLVGFNNRKYDNHIMYAAYLGYTVEQLYTLSQRLIAGSENAAFREAYNLSHADIYEFSSKKQSLKKFEIELGIHHQENEHPWDQPVPEDQWDEIVQYCCNDVIAAEATFEDRYSDYVAYEIVAEITGMPVNSNGNSMAARLIFGKDKNPKLVYTDLATGETSDPEYQKTDIITGFPGYEHVKNPETGKYCNMFRGVDVGFGGYVYAEPGMYTDVALLDVMSMHPHSIIAMNYFGEHTQNFKELVDSRIYIKHKDYETAKKMFGGKFAKFLAIPSKIEGLAYALKIFINKVYGMTSAKFDNVFRDKRNINNIVALRGALFMKTLQDEVAARGFTVVHIKTDSIKIANATKEIIDFCMDFAKKYGYTFEHEATYDRICLVNDAVYIAKYASSDRCQNLYGYVPGDNKKAESKSKLWTATGTEFQIPFVFKTLFSHEPIEFKDLCEIKQVTTSLYLDYNEGLPDTSRYENELSARGSTAKSKKLDSALIYYSAEDLQREIEKGHNYKFVGKIGQFTPVIDGVGGGVLVAKRDNKYNSATGAKGYRWLESEFVRNSGLEDKVDLRYYRGLVDTAIADISKYGDFEWFANSDDPSSEINHPPKDDDLPWLMPCKDPNKTYCEECSEFEICPYLKDNNCEDRDPFKSECVDCPSKDQCFNQLSEEAEKEADIIWNRR